VVNFVTRGRLAFEVPNTLPPQDREGMLSLAASESLREDRSGW